MPIAIPVDVREKILADYIAGKRVKVIVATYNVSSGTIKRLTRRWREANEHTERVPFISSLQIFRVEWLEVVRQLVEAEPAIALHVLAARVVAAGGPQTKRSALTRAIERLGLVRARPSKSDTVPGPVATSPRYRREAYIERPSESSGRRLYPSDLSDAEWGLIAPLVPAAKPGGRPFLHDRREMIDAILYVLRSGCAWRMLPHDFPPWKSVYTTFRRWSLSGVFEHLNEQLRPKAREQAGRKPVATAWIIDSQSTKTTEKGGSVDSTAARRSRAASGTFSSTFSGC